MRKHFPWPIPEPMLTEEKIRMIIDKAGIKFSDQGIQSVHLSVCNYQFRAYLDTLKNAPFPEIQKELKSFFEMLITARNAYAGMNPFILGPVTLIQEEWRKATDRLINQLKETEATIKRGRKKQYARVFLVHVLIKIFEDETNRKFIMQYAGFHPDKDRSEYDPLAMTFLKLVMDLLFPNLTSDSLRKDIARALKIHTD